jgi:uncharacterized protein YggE
MTRQTFTEIIAVTFLIAITTCLMVYASNNNDHNLHAQTTAIDNKTLFVTGSATTQTKPDKVTISLGVETTNAKAKTALAENSELMNKIINALNIAGVSENETSTSSFTITPNRDYTIDKVLGKLVGFTVSNSIQIDSYNINNSSEWIDISVASGANNVNNIYFSVSDKKLEGIKNELLKEAIGNAREKADIAASALGLEITGIKTINIDQTTPFFTEPMPYGVESLKSDAASLATPIIAGEQDISMTVSIVFLLGE